MRKHFLILMLMALLPLAGWAQGILPPLSYFKNGNFVYKVLTTPVANGTPGTAQLVGVRDGYNPVAADSTLTLDGHFNIVILEDNYQIVVTGASSDALKNNYDLTGTTTLVPKGEYEGKIRAKSVVIPKEYTGILAGTFVGYTNMKSISFEEGSEVKEVEAGAFTTTQIRTFDFSNCSKLATLANGIFVEPGFTNSYIKTIKLPINAENLISIGTAFQNLKKLETIENLDKTKITTVAALAFNGDDSLKTLVLPSTVVTIAATAFQGSGVKDLTIDVTSLDDATAGNVYGASLTTLEKLTLKGVLAGTFKPQAFKDCTKLATVDMTGMTITGGTIGANAFKGCTALTTLTFNDITEGTIGANAFEGCTALTSVEFGKIAGIDVKKALIDDNAFAGCLKLGTIKFGDLTHVTIDNSAFALADDPTATATALTFGELTDVVINASAFAGFTKMNKIEFGKTDVVNIASLAFANCTSGLAAKATATLEFKTSMKDVTIAGTAVADGAFYNTSKLSSIKFAESDNLNIQTYAFNNAASTGEAATVVFANAKNITIGESAFNAMAKAESISFGNITDDTLPNDCVIDESAFAGATGLKTLTFGDLTGASIEANAFLNASAALDPTAYESMTATFGNLDGTTIKDDAFKGADYLAIVKIGDIINGSQIGQSGAGKPVFPALKSATIGTVRNGYANTIGAGAFTFADYSGATLNLAYTPAKGETAAVVKSLECTAAVTLIAAGAFDFSAVTNAGALPEFVNPVVTIGEIKTENALAAGALYGDNIEKIVFAGDIVANGLNKMIIDDTDDDTVDTDPAKELKLKELVFDGAIATAGIATNAFKGLTQYMTITFNGKLAAGAIAAGAFEGLKGDTPVPGVVKKHSLIKYTYNGDDIDLTVNPFAKRAFDNTTAYSDQDTDTDVDIDDVDIQTPRQIQLSIKNEALAAKFFENATDGLGTFDGTYAIYRVIVVMPTPPVPESLTFLVYPDLKNTPTNAWARWELGKRVDPEVTGTLAAGTDLVIKRVQMVDSVNTAKITIYGTYTDEDDALNAATVYMVPLKVTNGYYHIPGTNKTTLIVKVENNGAAFTKNSYKVEVNHDDADDALDWPAYVAANNSIWDGLVNKELFVASQIMTNQQLVDKTATDPANAGGAELYGYYHGDRDAAAIDIYRGGATIAEDLYIMNDPSKNKGFRIDKMPITSDNNAYINTGWYYMLLKHYKGQSAAARVVWMDDATEGEITGILAVKSNEKMAVKNDAIYTLQGVRVNQMQKGQIYIVNGKKFLAK